MEEYEIWMEWLELEWNRPSRTDHYIMQATQEIVRNRAKYPAQVKLDPFKMSFVVMASNSDNTMSEEDQLAMTKVAWCGVVGYKGAVS